MRQNEKIMAGMNGKKIGKEDRVLGTRRPIFPINKPFQSLISLGYFPMGLWFILSSLPPPCSLILSPDIHFHHYLVRCPF